MAQGKMNLNLSDMIYACATDSVKWFPQAQSPAFMALAMAGEVGEVCNLIKKVERGSKTLDEVKMLVSEEMVDVLIYLINMMGLPEFRDVNWESIWNEKRDFNQARFGEQDEIIVGVGTLAKDKHDFHVHNPYGDSDPQIAGAYNPYGDSERPH